MPADPSPANPPGGPAVAVPIPELPPPAAGEPATESRKYGFKLPSLHHLLPPPPTESHNRRRRGQVANWVRITDLALRVLMVPVLFGFVIYWFSRVLAIVEGQAGTSARLVSDRVLITLLATTTANVIGLISAVVLYLFPARGRKRRRSRTPPR